MLKCDLKLTPSVEPLTFPPGLRELHLGMTGNPTDTDVNTTIEVISYLPMLDALALFVPAIDSQLSLAPLASLQRLRVLGINRLDGFNAQAANLSDAQVAQLRSLPLLQLLEMRSMSTSVLRRLLASRTICNGSRSRCLVC